MKQFAFNKNKKIFLMIFGFLVILASSIATYTYFIKQNQDNTKSLINDSNQSSLMTPNKLNKISDEDIERSNELNILLLGYGGAGHSGGLLTDVIQIIHFDFKKEKISFISIPRDLWIKLPNNKTNKINQAFSIGGTQMSTDIVEKITGLKIDNYISIDFVGFKRAIGYELKGIKVNVLETLDDPWYPISGKEQDTCGKSPEEVAQLSAKFTGFQLEKQFECRYEHINFKKGINYMEGGDALAYVRSRHGSLGGDFSRSQRQQQLLIAIKNRLFELDALDNIPGFFKQMIKHTNTDLNIETIKKLSPLLVKSKNFKIQNITLSTSNVFKSSKSNTGQYIVVPKNNWNEVENYIKQELDK